MSIILYRLHDDVIRSSAINLHLTFELGLPITGVCTALCVATSNDPVRDSNEPPAVCLHHVTCVLLFPGKPATDDVKLSELSLKPGMKVMMMGTREEELASVIEPPSLPDDVVNDFDIEDDEVAIQYR